MSRYFITGDTHGFSKRLDGVRDSDKLWRFAEEHKELTKDDYVIVLGDFGGLFLYEKINETLDKFASLPFSIIFIDGNHDNIDAINEYPIEEWNGGNIHRIRDDIIHLIRGEIYKIKGYSVFAFGGALSIDRGDRDPWVNYWPNEIPSYQEYIHAMDNLESHNNEVDYIFTHTCDAGTIRDHFKFMDKFGDQTAKMLQTVENTISYKHWYFGHLHFDEVVNEKKRCFYQDIIEVFKE